MEHDSGIGHHFGSGEQATHAGKWRNDNTPEASCTTDENINPRARVSGLETADSAATSSFAGYNNT